jgi:periplasmic protein TonB
MFQENLLESSPVSAQRKRWPMAAAFTSEAIVAGALILIPLITTAVIPVSARVSIVAPLGSVHAAAEKTAGRSGNTEIHSTHSVFRLANNHSAISFDPKAATESTNDTAPPGLGDPRGLPDLPTGGDRVVPALLSRPPRILTVSHLDEAQLLKRVQPIYPQMAVIAQIQGDVKLHAIIAKDGSIQSLNVVSGHPTLAAAAVAAVRQWRYRPYYLNGDPVEVETFITVSFKRIRD